MLHIICNDTIGVFTIAKAIAKKVTKKTIRALLDNEETALKMVSPNIFTTLCGDTRITHFVCEEGAIPLLKWAQQQMGAQQSIRALDLETGQEVPISEYHYAARHTWVPVGGYESLVPELVVTGPGGEMLSRLLFAGAVSLGGFDHQCNWAKYAVADGVEICFSTLEVNVVIRGYPLIVLPSVPVNTWVREFPETQGMFKKNT